MNTLFDVNAFTKTALVDGYRDSNDGEVSHYDPSWDEDEIVLDNSITTIEESGQVSLFYDSSGEPPEPDDFSTVEEFNRAWSNWEKLHPELNVKFMNDSVPNENSEGTESKLSQRQVSDKSLISQGQVSDDSVPNESSEGTESKGKIKIYSPKGKARTNNKYFKFSYKDKGKTINIHIPGGCTSSPIALKRVAVVEEAIRAGKPPNEITQIIKNFTRREKD